MIPLRDVIPSRTTPVVTVTLIAINTLAFLYFKRVVLSKSLYGSVGILPILMLGLALFALSNLGAGFASSVEVLVALRVLTGVASPGEPDLGAGVDEHELALAHHADAVGVAVESDPGVGFVLFHAFDHVLEIALHGGIGGMVREAAVGLAEDVVDVDAQRLQDRDIVRMAFGIATCRHCQCHASQHHAE